MDAPNEKFFSLTDNLFTFSTHSCDCVTDVENISPGVVKETIKMQGLPEKPIRFAFAPSRGMVRLANSGAICGDRLLTDLMDLTIGNKNALFSFFAENGFLFPLSTNEYEAVNLDALYSVIARVKAVVKLMGAIGEPRKDYKRILGFALYLLLSRPVEFNLSCFGSESFKTCQHGIFLELERAASLPMSNQVTAFNNDSYTIVDTIFNPISEISIDQISGILGGFSDSPLGCVQSQMFRNIARLYVNAPNLPYDLRLMIDFLFHYQHSIGIIKSFNSDGSIEYYDSDEFVKEQHTKYFNDAMKRALVEIAKITIREEIGYNLYGMRPCYDIQTMSPAWEIQDLLTGIYVSIFFMKPGLELYRECSNPNCNRMFLVATTSSKRKYCSSSCRNANSQRAHRLRKQVMEE